MDSEVARRICRRNHEIHILAAKILKRDVKKMKLRNDGVLVRRGKDGVDRIVLPKTMYHTIYDNLHVDMGHLGAERVVELARRRVYSIWQKGRQQPTKICLKAYHFL